MTPRRLFAPFLAFLLLLSGPGAAQQADEVEGLVVAKGEAPLPIVGRGAPNYSPEQTASFICENQDLGVFRLVTGPMLQAAHDATLRARKVRIDAFNGLATEAQMVEAELDRQRAVGVLGGGGREQDFGPARKGDLEISGVVWERSIENGRPVLVVRGEIVNSGAAKVELPPVSLRSLDVRGFVLAGQTTQLEQVEIGPGQTLAFALRFKNPPQYTAKVLAHFAPPFMVRNFRGCAFFDPLDFDPNESTVRRNVARRGDPPPVPAPQVGEGAPQYTAAELAALVMRARREAELAFGVSATAPCAAIRRDWRSRMVLADRVEEAWIATNAAEEVRRDAARGVFLHEEVVQAELDRQAAVRAAVAARPPSAAAGPAPAGLSVREARVVESGDETEVRVRIANDRSARADVPLLRIQLLDRFGTVAVESFQQPNGDVRARRDATFSFGFPLPKGLVSRAVVDFAC